MRGSTMSSSLLPFLFLLNVALAVKRGCPNFKTDKAPYYPTGMSQHSTN